MKLIIGLGNPGMAYKKTRHNIGFMFLDYFVDKNNYGQFHYESKFKGDILTTNIGGEKIIFLKPQTFMNLSGESVQKVVNYYKIDNKDIIVVFDDITMVFGKLRFRQKGSYGGQNGAGDIIKHIGEEFGRIKIGIGFDKKYNLSDWVLSKFTEEEFINIDNEVFPKVEEMLEEKFL
ncbi:aminoacyl-tRNA hydrolase [Candidatus Gracilibacteria bacterium]|nr:aminoacyl-tRNA hydrolase [Candidatus Gracilibacteria bacterium]